jgi:hypothetical protein
MFAIIISSAIFGFLVGDYLFCLVKECLCLDNPFDIWWWDDDATMWSFEKKLIADTSDTSKE